jgi:hypothetical protein
MQPPDAVGSPARDVDEISGWATEPLGDPHSEPHAQPEFGSADSGQLTGGAVQLGRELSPRELLGPALLVERGVEAFEVPPRRLPASASGSAQRAGSSPL